MKQLISIRSLFPFSGKEGEARTLSILCWALVMYTIFAGAIRKWVLGPGSISNTLLFAQILLPFVMYVVTRVFIRSKSNFESPSMFVLFFTYLLLTAFNPLNHTIYHGIFGLFLHLGFWVGVIAYFQRRETFELESLVGFLLLILIIEIVLSSIQYSLPDDHILNIKANGKAIDATVGTAVRVSGTFSYLGGYQVMITFYGFLIWALIVLNYPFYVPATVFALSLYGALMSGSRGALIMLMFLSVFSLLQGGYIFKKVANVAATFALILGGLYYFGSDLIKSFDTAYENFNDRVQDGLESGETDARLEDYFVELMEFRGKYPIFGIGLGSTYQGANALFGESRYAKEYGYYEAEWGRIVLEGGFVLFFLRIVLLIVFLRNSYLPFSGKIVFILYFLGSVTIFNTYQSFFMLLGFMIVDRAYYVKRSPASQVSQG